MTHKLLVITVAWGRPHFLRRTLQSLAEQLRDIPGELVVVDNGSKESTRQVIQEYCEPDKSILWDDNRGINAAVDAALTKWLTPDHRWVLVSDADMEYQQSFWQAIELLKANPAIGAVSFQHSPEHESQDELDWNGRTWPLKRSERGCALLMSVETLNRVRPLPVDNLKDFDWWVCRDAPVSLQAQNQSIAVLVGGAKHLGWRRGDSTWQDLEIPEYEEFR